MARVLALLENHSDTINGVKFTMDHGQLLSEEVSDDVAAGFAAIPGFKLVEEKRGPGRPKKNVDPGESGEPKDETQ